MVSIKARQRERERERERKRERERERKMGVRKHVIRTGEKKVFVMVGVDHNNRDGF